MLLKKSPITFAASAVVLYILLFITGCSCGPQKPDVSGITIKIKAKRFEQDLFSLDTAKMLPSVLALKENYGQFFDLFAFQITTLGSKDSLVTAARFKEFVGDTNFRRVYTDCESRFKDFTIYEEEISESFRLFSYYNPGTKIPNLVTLISAFSFPVICDSNNLGISLDMYLGSDYQLYGTIQPPLPNYLRSRMTKEYLVSDAMKGWLMSDYSTDGAVSLVEEMVAEGRLVYVLDKILPETPDTIKTGYSKSQLDWCLKNEKQIWSFFIQNKLLFTDAPDIMTKYVGEGPTTGGFPKESPGNIGQFIGWQIVKSYMQKNKEATVQSLLKEKDLKKIFNESAYKPSK